MNKVLTAIAMILLNSSLAIAAKVTTVPASMKCTAWFSSSAPGQSGEFQDQFEMTLTVTSEDLSLDEFGNREASYSAQFDKKAHPLVAQKLNINATVYRLERTGWNNDGYATRYHFLVLAGTPRTLRLAMDLTYFDSTESHAYGQISLQSGIGLNATYTASCYNLKF